MSYLQIDGVSKQYDDFTALQSISLTVEQGEFICFLGPSGCGKTTLLRTIAGLEEQTTGRIIQGGQDISDLPPSKRDFGIVFQSYALFPNLTVAQNIVYGLKQGRKKKERNAQRVNDLLAMMEIPDQGHKYPSQLSGGQQQRVAVARALAPEPNLLLLDEPLSALDAKVREHLRKQMKSIQRELGVTFILVTHDQEEAISMADRIVVMNQGRIEQVGTPTEIYEKPNSAFVADFIGQMNFFRGQSIQGNAFRMGSSTLKLEHIGENICSGEEVLFCIRPEKVSLWPDKLQRSSILQLKVSHLEFRGSYCRVEFVLPQELRFDRSTLYIDLTEEEMQRANLTLGKNTDVYLPHHQMHVFPQKEAVQAVVAA
ncbi:MAG: putative 2-aminoethylphosphonate ABC transporter ATP-binding protein [SAR324 cluster bacterium]|uniref:Putative 2-aminoethylphosphonate ABC transporter ATP-binding protein n=1 Tax=SAR324 cluster bacterium TaxID=2024889 RepID=A0A2A4SSA8_9DELT|nr:MAG: putative 2-aminoethylphosphonate ABC transporter ATP-binding protein [SAR324 cluster bacterium]